ncbi:Bcr/CflA family drug resistance efflux transporter [Gibbsiella quercinecans]|nr:Bcr/CflA family drug resistance efflux transporter [Gibbsiella quercinecans]
MSSFKKPESGVSTGWAVGLGLVTTLGPMSIDMYLPSLPGMSTEFGTDYATMQLTLTVFLLALGSGQIIFGPVIDALGRRKPLLIAILVYVLSSVWAAMAGSPDTLILTRFLQGLAASLALVTAMSSVRDRADGVRAAQIFAFLMTIQGVGPVIAPALGGVIGAQFGWRMVFIVLTGLGIMVALSSFVLLPESLSPEKRIRLNLRSIIRVYAEILTDRFFLLPALALALVFVFLFAYIGGAAFAYQEGYGMSTAQFGMIFGITGLAVLIGAMGSARLVTFMRIERLATCGAAMTLLGALIALFSVISGTGINGIIAGMFISLVGLGTAEATLMSIALSTRQTALGASAAILGAVPLILGAAATSVAAAVVETGTTAWITLLVVTGLAVTLLTLLSARMMVRAGIKASFSH